MIFKDKFGFTRDTEFIIHEPADCDKVHSYEYEDGPGPDLKSPKFDLKRNSKSLWNSAVLDIILQNLKDQCAEEEWPIQQSDSYIRQLLMDQYKRLRTMWKKAQPKLTDNGTVETPVETEARLIAKRQLVLKQCRQTTCCHSVSPKNLSNCSRRNHPLPEICSQGHHSQSHC